MTLGAGGIGPSSGSSFCRTLRRSATIRSCVISFTSSSTPRQSTERLRVVQAPEYVLLSSRPAIIGTARIGICSRHMYDVQQAVNIRTQIIHRTGSHSAE